MLPTSLPGGSPGGMTSARPTSARAASCARRGMRAASRGVRPSSSARGTSAQPSGTNTTYLTATDSTGTFGIAWLDAEPQRRVHRVHHVARRIPRRVQQQLEAGGNAVDGATLSGDDHRAGELVG